MHAHPRTIDKCIRGDSLTAFNYIWKRYDEKEIPNKISPYIKNKNKSQSVPIARIDENGEIISTYPSIKKASEDTGIDTHSIRDVLKGKSKQTRGLRFKLL